jgi:hypothetical protein
VPLLLPRVTGLSESATTFSEGGAHSESSRVHNAMALRCMMKGSLTKRLLPWVKRIVREMCEEGDCLTGSVSASARCEMLRCLLELLEKIRGVDGKLLTAHFNVTGRLADLDGIWITCCKKLLGCKFNADGHGKLRDIADRGLGLLRGEGAEGGGGGSMNTNNVGLKTWAPRIHQDAIAEIMDEGHPM